MLRAVQLAMSQCSRRSDAQPADQDDEDVDVDVDVDVDTLESDDVAMPALEEESPACKALAHVFEKLAQTYSALKQARAETLVEKVYLGTSAYDALKRVKETLECLGLDVYHGAPVEEPNAELWKHRAKSVEQGLNALHKLSLSYSQRFLL
jgi:hypothetical protein